MLPLLPLRVANVRYQVANPPLVHHDYSLGSLRRQYNFAAVSNETNQFRRCFGIVEAGAHNGDDCEHAWGIVAKENGAKFALNVAPVGKGALAKADAWCRDVRGCDFLPEGRA
eukprot:SAG31_NODE_19892_length_589_cov_0.822449_1_plen_113_part_00